MNLTEICIRKPVLAWMMISATVLFGLVAGRRIGISQFPDVDFPTISVSLSWEGASPESMESEVVEVLEEALVQVEGVQSITSSARQGGASLTLELAMERDVDLALQDVQTRIAQSQRRLPRDMDPATVSKTNPEDQPILWLGLSGPFPRQRLTDIARYQVKEKLQTLPGVGEITMGGYLERNVRIWLDGERLDERGLTVGEVTRALQAGHVELPAGRLETEGREINVRVLGEALDLESFRNLEVGNQRGTPVYLRDVALVEDGFEDVRSMARVNGQPAMGLGIRKQRGANAVEVAAHVKTAMAQLQTTLPEGMELAINFDSTQFIADSVHEIQFELVLSVLLTALVCWIFLGSLSSTLNVILAIPMSLLGTVAVIYFLGYTFNTFTLLAMALAVGIVVDDAIMVMENIFRHGEMGKDKVTAAREGTAEITFAALSATIAVVAIFLPVIFMKGVVGRFFMQFGVTLCVAVLFSYVEAVTLAPARCAQLLDTSREGRGGVGRLADRVFSRIERAYHTTLGHVLTHPGKVLVGALLLTVGAIAVLRSLPGEFVPTQDQSRLMVRVQTAVGANINETDQLMTKVEARVLAHPEVLRCFGVVGGMGSGQVNSAFLFVTLVEPGERTFTHLDFAGVLRKELNSIPGVRAMVQDPSQQGFTARRGFPIEFSVRGSDWDDLVLVSGGLKKELEASGLAVDVDTDYQVGMPELRVTPDRARCADLGIPVEDVAGAINALVGGLRVGKYSEGGRRLDVRMRLLAGQRSRPEDLMRLRVRTAAGELVPLSSVVVTEERPALQAITRRDRERAITITANVAPGHAQQEVLAAVEEMGRDLPGGHRLVLGGASVAFKESMGSLLMTLFLGIAVAYMVLASQFNSLLHPVTVLTILPLSVAGAAGGLWLAGKSLNIFSMIGLLLLLGIVKKNSIILVDYARQAQARGLAARDALLEAGPKRLRPILMTSTATMMAALPSALGLGPGSEIRSPMAIGILTGLAVSTALSLLVVPAFHLKADQWLDGVREWRRRRWLAKLPPTPPGA
ncbi:MAG: efflux RND transporter permease subunit [Candidatus Delongbacteria bacterium]